MSENFKQKIDMLANMVRDFNYTSASLRDKLRSAVPAPFHMDPLLHVTIAFEEPIAVDELVATEIFSKHYIEISAIRVIDQVIEFEFNTEDGEDTLEYNLSIYDNTNDMELWQIYLLSLIAPRIIEYIKGKMEEMSKFMEFLDGIMEKIDKRGEKNE